MIFDKKGYVLTNDHVIEVAVRKLTGSDEGKQVEVTVGKLASKIKVTLPDGRSFDAKIQGRDRMLDVAVLKMEGAEGQDLPVATLGDSAKARAGQFVWTARGHP
jgi:S1-C subfamily serine protease